MEWFMHHISWWVVLLDIIVVGLLLILTLAFLWGGLSLIAEVVVAGKKLSLCYVLELQQNMKMMK